MEALELFMIGRTALIIAHRRPLMVNVTGC